MAKRSILQAHGTRHGSEPASPRRPTRVATPRRPEEPELPPQPVVLGADARVAIWVAGEGCGARGRPAAERACLRALMRACPGGGAACSAAAVGDLRACRQVATGLVLPGGLVLADAAREGRKKKGPLGRRWTGVGAKRPGSSASAFDPFEEELSRAELDELEVGGLEELVGSTSTSLERERELERLVLGREMGAGGAGFRSLRQVAPASAAGRDGGDEPDDGADEIAAYSAATAVSSSVLDSPAPQPWPHASCRADPSSALSERAVLGGDSAFPPALAARLAPALRELGWRDVHVVSRLEEVSDADAVVMPGRQASRAAQLLRKSNPGAALVLTDGDSGTSGSLCLRARLARIEGAELVLATAVEAKRDEGGRPIVDVREVSARAGGGGDPGDHALSRALAAGVVEAFAVGGGGATPIAADGSSASRAGPDSAGASPTPGNSSAPASETGDPATATARPPPPAATVRPLLPATWSYLYPLTCGGDPTLVRFAAFFDKGLGRLAGKDGPIEGAAWGNREIDVVVAVSPDGTRSEVAKLATSEILRVLREAPWDAQAGRADDTTLRVLLARRDPDPAALDRYFKRLRSARFVACEAQDGAGWSRCELEAVMLGALPIRIPAILTADDPAAGRTARADARSPSKVTLSTPALVAEYAVELSPPLPAAARAWLERAGGGWVIPAGARARPLDAASRAPADAADGDHTVSSLAVTFAKALRAAAFQAASPSGSEAAARDAEAARAALRRGSEPATVAARIAREIAGIFERRAASLAEAR